MVRGVGSCTVFIALAFAAATPAVAADAPPIEDVSAIDQYRESVPTASGKRALGERGGVGEPLAPVARARLRASGGADAELLEDLATSPALGSPAESPSVASQAGPLDRSSVSAGGAVAAAAGEDRSVALMLVVVLA